ncbi:MAG: UDP-N-acetylmuramoyl-L-alanine--D-glutamate ligase [Thiotrichales bacterium]|nr:UDP-N-acetylmuramoyl-L-alanine--D-glutamate ligase [Thiotrichales bacterium]
MSSTASTVVVGLGKTGLSCARYLQRQGHDFAVTDNRDLPSELTAFKQEFPGTELVTGRFDEQLILNAGRILLSPGVAVTEPVIVKALDKGIPVLGDVEIFCREVRAPIIAVTGSNGKSTVASLVAAMAGQSGVQAQLGGNIGTPVLELLDAPAAELYVLELSSFQLELTRSLNAQAAAVLNVSEDHMDRYRTIEEYLQAKAGIYAGDGCMVINLDDPRVLALQDTDRKHIAFSCDAPAAGQFGLLHDDGKPWIAHGDTRLLACDSLRIHGQHNYQNAMAALALGTAAGLPMASMIQALQSFSGLPHRCEWIGRLDDVDWVNDSKATNVGASCAAIRSLAGDNNLILIAGGDSKGADLTPLQSAVQDRVKHVITLGRDGPAIQQLLQKLTTVTAVDSMQEAVARARAQASAGDLVLLSPACASLDMFRDYMDRGQQFTRAAQALGVDK